MKKNTIVSLADANYFPLLEELIDFIVSTYVEPEKEELDDSDIDDLLDGLGVERE